MSTNTTSCQMTGPTHLKHRKKKEKALCSIERWNHSRENKLVKQLYLGIHRKDIPEDLLVYSNGICSYHGSLFLCGPCPHWGWAFPLTNQPHSNLLSFCHLRGCAPVTPNSPCIPTDHCQHRHHHCGGDRGIQPGSCCMGDGVIHHWLPLLWCHPLACRVVSLCLHPVCAVPLLL